MEAAGAAFGTSSGCTAFGGPNRSIRPAVIVRLQGGEELTDDGGGVARHSIDHRRFMLFAECAAFLLASQSVGNCWESSGDRRNHHLAIRGADHWRAAQIVRAARRADR